VIPVEVPRYGRSGRAGGVRNVRTRVLTQALFALSHVGSRVPIIEGGVDEVAVTELVSTSI